MVTTKEIARIAKVSVSTVNHVINNRNDISEKTAKKIRSIIKKSNYQPNIFARNLVLSRKLVFAILMPRVTKDTKYWNCHLAGIQKAEKEFEQFGLKIEYFFFNIFSKRSFRTAVKKCLHKKPDGLLLAPIHSELVHDYFKKKVFHKIPVVFIDSDIPDINKTAFIGQNSFQSGTLAARLMNILIIEDGTIIIIRPMLDDYHINERIKGFTDYFPNKHPTLSLKIVDLERTKTKYFFNKTLNKAFKSSKNIKGIFVPNAQVYHAAKYIWKKKKNNVTLIGYDLIRENVNYLKKGIIDFLISQRPEVQGYEGISALYRKVILKRPVKNEKRIMPIDIITRENLDDYINYK